MDEPQEFPILWVRLIAQLLDIWQSGQPFDQDSDWVFPDWWTDADRSALLAEIGPSPTPTNRDVIQFFRDVLMSVLPPETKTVLKLLAWTTGVVEVAPGDVVVGTTAVGSDPAAFAVTFADPATSPGGVVHLNISGAPRPSTLTAVFVPTGTVPDEGRTPEALVGNAAYPQGSEAVDPTADITAISVTAANVTPGSWDVGVFGEFPDPA